MHADYIASVIGFCEVRASRIRLLTLVEIGCRAFAQLLGTGTPHSLDALEATLGRRNARQRRRECGS